MWHVSDGALVGWRCVWWHHGCFGFGLRGVAFGGRCVGINERMRRSGINELANLDFIVRVQDVWMGVLSLPRIDGDEGIMVPREMARQYISYTL
jgi:hypothetical protein